MRFERRIRDKRSSEEDRRGSSLINSSPRHSPVIYANKNAPADSPMPFDFLFIDRRDRERTDSHLACRSTRLILSRRSRLSFHGNRIDRQWDRKHDARKELWRAQKGRCERKGGGKRGGRRGGWIDHVRGRLRGTRPIMESGTRAVPDTMHRGIRLIIESMGFQRRCTETE